MDTEAAISYYQKYQHLKRLPLNDSYLKLRNEVGQLESAKQNAISQINQARKETEEQSKAFQYYRNQCEQTITQSELNFNFYPWM